MNINVAQIYIFADFRFHIREHLFPEYGRQCPKYWAPNVS